MEPEEREPLDLPYVYVSGPYSQGDVILNIRAAIEAAEGVSNLNAIPYVPHLTAFYHAIKPHSYQFWLWYDLQWLKLCDVLLRIPGESCGADREEEYARTHGIPVAHSLEELAEILKGV